MSVTEFYFKLPIVAQNAATCVASAKNRWERYGRPFGQILDGYRERARWSADRLAEYRDARLRNMIDHCYRTVPYYKRMFHEGGVNPDSIKSIDDLSRLPVLTKDEVRACPDDFISSDFANCRLIHRHTSGTTGELIPICHGSSCLHGAVGSGVALLGRARH